MPTDLNTPVPMFRVYSSSSHSLSCQWVACREWRHYFSSLVAVITWLNARPIDPPTHGRDVQTSVITLGLRRHAARRRVLKGGVIRTLFSCHITCWCKKLSSERRPTQFAMPLNSLLPLLHVCTQECSRLKIGKTISTTFVFTSPGDLGNSFISSTQ